jgi:alanine dehydrogenase
MIDITAFKNLEHLEHPKLKIGIIGSSYKENEKRLPIHPADLLKIPIEYRPYILIDTGYGINFGYTDEQLKSHVGKILTKEEIYKIADVILVLKFTKQDYELIRPKKICWGWHHLVQNKQNVDIIINKELTTVSIENMFNNGKYILEDNRHIAGYASIMHAMQLKGLTGYLLEEQPKIAILSYGCVGKGAVDAFTSLDFTNVDVYTKRDPNIVDFKRQNINYFSYPLKWFDTLKNYDIIVNCILQDPLDPIIFLTKEELLLLNKKMFIIDISCDFKMGFDFAIPTSFNEPIIKITEYVDFYGVDHSPSVYYNTITMIISNKLLQYLYKIIDCDFDIPDIKNAIEIDKGIIINNEINKFQKRV